ncbi:MAG: hypothetical protein P0Y53_04990 [Candidatus Pseudobacter hemicellulosilyticus]|uniref:DUF4394 domain-containing protein n=1 Tax=Candidatus Pseudobacter hemicellulosilyticus TaxID=3121375 RepID=A0AAJ5WRI6_9BACT|nr:MAG: hypothetical protein P0Y53_04990 [Pseudobacter sp.]
MQQTFSVSAVLMVLLLGCSQLSAQQLKLGVNPWSLTKSALLELNSTNQGLLFTRIADTALINVQSPPDGTVIYFTPMQQLLVRSGGAWKSLLYSVSGPWSIIGNSGTTPTTNFLGTTDAQSLAIRTNNVERMRVFSTGGVAIGATALDAGNPEALLVDAGTSSSFNVISGKGTVNNYLQLNIQNRSATALASSDLVATADNGTELVNYVDLGINSSGFSNATYPIINGNNTAYLYATGADFVIGNATASRNLRFFAGGYATTNEAMRVTSAGLVGVANTAPAAYLDVGNTFKLGAKGSVNKNQISFALTLGSTVLNAGAVGILGLGYMAGMTDVNFTITTTSLQPTSTQATVVITPAFDLPNYTSIAFARLTGVNTIKVRFLNTSTSSTLNVQGTYYFTITEF